MRQLLIEIHKYAGLTLGLLLSVTALSGSLLVFDRELDELLSPATVDFEGAATLANFQVAIDAAVAAVDSEQQPSRLMLGRHAAAPHIIRFPTQPGATGPVEVSIDPGSGEALAVRTWGEYPVTWIYRLHLNFLGGERGETVVGLMGFLMLLFCVSGLVIWWPRNGRWRRALTLRWSRNNSPRNYFRLNSFRLNYDLHKLIGVYLLPVFIMLAITGIEIVWHEPFERVVASLLPVEEEPAPASSVGTEPLDIDEVANLAQARFPESRIARIYLPRTATDSWHVTFMHPEERWREYGASSVWVDRFSGELTGVRDLRELPAGSRLLAWMFPLHNGDALGLAGRLLVFLSGLLIPVLFGTGVFMWLKKRRKSANSQRLAALRYE